MNKRFRFVSSIQLKKVLVVCLTGFLLLFNTACSSSNSSKISSNIPYYKRYPVEQVSKVPYYKQRFVRSTGFFSFLKKQSVEQASHVRYYKQRSREQINERYYASRTKKNNMSKTNGVSSQDMSEVKAKIQEL